MESECGVQLSQLAAQSNLALEQAAWNTCIVSSISYATAAVGNGKLVPFSTVGLQQPQCSPLEVAKIWADGSCSTLLPAARVVMLAYGITAVSEPLFPFLVFLPTVPPSFTKRMLLLLLLYSSPSVVSLGSTKVLKTYILRFFFWFESFLFPSKTIKWDESEKCRIHLNNYFVIQLFTLLHLQLSVTRWPDLMAPVSQGTVCESLFSVHRKLPAKLVFEICPWASL